MSALPMNSNLTSDEICPQCGVQLWLNRKCGVCLPKSLVPDYEVYLRSRADSSLLDFPSYVEWSARRTLIDSGVPPEVANELIELATDAGRAIGAPWWKFWAWRAHRRRWRNRIRELGREPHGVGKDAASHREQSREHVRDGDHHKNVDAGSSPRVHPEAAPAQEPQQIDRLCVKCRKRPAIEDHSICERCVPPLAEAR